jgi:hypothetical protein
MQDNLYELKAELDLEKYAPSHRRVGRAESILAVLNRAIQQTHIELRLAKRELRETNGVR